MSELDDLREAVAALRERLDHFAGLIAEDDPDWGEAGASAIWDVDSAQSALMQAAWDYDAVVG